MRSELLFGVLRDADGEHLRLEIADGVVIKVARAAVGTVVQPKLVEHEPEEN